MIENDADSFLRHTERYGTSLRDGDRHMRVFSTQSGLVRTKVDAPAADAATMCAAGLSCSFACVRIRDLIALYVKK